MSDFGRLLTAMVTPFNAEFEIDYEKTKELIEHLIKTGTDTIVVGGSTGEPASLSMDEKLRLFKFAVERAQGRVKIIAGTGTNDTRSSIRLTRKAQQTGIDGVLLVAPYYNKPSQEGLYQHFKSIAANTDLPVVLYNIPGRSAVNISTETLLRLSRIENITAIKEASGDLSKVGYLIENVPPGFKIYSGDDSLALPILSIGGYGVISVASHIAGSEIKGLITAYLKGRVKEAAETHRQLLPIFEGLFIAANPSPVKFALSEHGINVGTVRLPLVSLTEGESKHITEIMGQLKEVGRGISR